MFNYFIEISGKSGNKEDNLIPCLVKTHRPDLISHFYVQTTYK